MLLTRLGLWIFSGHSCAGLCGPRSRSQEEQVGRAIRSEAMAFFTGSLDLTPLPAMTLTLPVLSSPSSTPADSPNAPQTPKSHLVSTFPLIRLPLHPPLIRPPALRAPLILRASASPLDRPTPLSGVPHIILSNVKDERHSTDTSL